MTVDIRIFAGFAGQAGRLAAVRQDVEGLLGSVSGLRRFLLLERTQAVTMEASLSWELRRQVMLAGNPALVQSLFHSQPGSAAPTDVPDDIIAAIEEVDEPGSAAWVPAHA